MAEIKPFRGLIYDPKNYPDLTKVSAPPYDVIDPKEQDELYTKNPFNVIRLILGKEESADSDSENKYTRAARFMNEWHRQGILVTDDAPAFYVYRQDYPLKDKQISRIGVIARVKLEDFSKGVIIPHEKTLSKAKTDRLNLLRATRTNLSQVFGLFQDSDGEISNILGDACVNEPVFRSAQADEVKNTVWRITDPAAQLALESAFADKKIYIADGHHRYETALNYLREKQGTADDHPGNNYVMMMLVDFAQQDLTILPTHRVLKSLPKINFQNLLQNLGNYFEVTQLSSSEEMEKALEKHQNGHAFGFITEGASAHYLLVLKTDELALDHKARNSSNNLAMLDVSILQNIIFNRVLGIANTNIESTIKFTPYLEEAVRMVKDGGFQMAFILNPTKIEELKAVANNQEIMPQKSTYFFPKLLSGLVMNRLTD